MTSPVPTSDPAFPNHLVGLAETVCDAYYAAYPDTDERYGGRGRAYCVHDNAYLAAWLIRAVELESSAILGRDVRWLADLLEARAFPMDRFAHNLELVASAVVEAGLSEAGAVEATLRPVVDGLTGGPR